MMAQGRREQVRFSMLPNMAGKFDVARFLRTGYAGEGGRRMQSSWLPDTPAMREALEQHQREWEKFQELRHGKQK